MILQNKIFFMYRLLYLDRVQFQGKKAERQFPTAITCTMIMVDTRDTAKKLPKEYGRIRIIERINYHDIAVLTHVDLDKHLNREGRDMQPSTTLFISVITIVEKCPHCLHGKEQAANPNVDAQLHEVYYHMHNSIVISMLFVE